MRSTLNTTGTGIFPNLVLNLFGACSVRNRQCFHNIVYSLITESASQRLYTLAAFINVLIHWFREFSWVTSSFFLTLTFIQSGIFLSLTVVKYESATDLLKYKRTNLMSHLIKTFNRVHLNF